MPKVKLKYFVQNNLNEYVVKEAGRRMTSEGQLYSKSKVLEDIAKYAGCGLENMKRINRNVAQPSLVVALRIAEYFKVNVEEIFKVVE